MQISICVLTFNSDKTLKPLLDQLLKLNAEMVVVDSGSSDRTLDIIHKASEQGNVRRIDRPYQCHSDQMNYAIDQASHDWVLCMDSDEIPDDQFILELQGLLKSFDPEQTGQAGRIKRNWYVLGRKVHAMYPCSSPDYVVRFFNRKQCRFNDSVVDDKVIGFDQDFILAGEVDHHTFETQEAMDRKLDAYVRRLKSGSAPRKIRRRARLPVRLRPSGSGIL